MRCLCGTTLTKMRDLADLAGVVEVPPEKRGVPWEEIRGQIRIAQAKRWRRRNFSTLPLPVRGSSSIGSMVVGTL